MKRLFILLAFVAFTFAGRAQTVENIRVTQDGDQLKITYRIGASTEAQLFNVFLSCSMAGASRFEPKAVIGDVGENVIGGKSYYTVMWDVFEDVDEVIDPNITVRVELVSDAAVDAAGANTTRQVQEEVKELPVQPDPQQAKVQGKPAETVQKVESREQDPFRRNGFFNFSGVTGFGIPIGISFGSLNNWGYYVTPLRLGIYTFDSWDGYSIVPDFDLSVSVTAGVTKHIISAGPYRLHGYGGLGGHVIAKYMATDPASTSHIAFETGVVNVIGGFNLTLGLMYSAGYVYPFSFVYGFGFVF